MLIVNSKKIVLFTGAGFTANFGGLLGREMWYEIYNNSKTKQSKNIRNLLLENTDYESVYSLVLNDVKYTNEEKHIMNEVIQEVYQNLDETITLASSSGAWDEIFNLFNGTEKEPCFHFTLNQDLFWERHRKFDCPGAPKFPEQFKNSPGAKFNDNFFVTLPRDNAKELVKRGVENHVGLHYVKLHGSYGWRSSDGSNQMVIGKNKENIIKKEPLLDVYFDLFQDVVKSGNKKLLIVGYGFGDMHINKVLLDGVINYNLKFDIISPSPIEKFKDIFYRNGHYYAKDLLDGLDNYFLYKLSDLHNHPERIRRIKTALLS